MPLDAVQSFDAARAEVLRRLSTASVGALANALVAITDAHSLTESERQRLQSAYEAIGDFLSEDPRFRDVIVRVHAQGSMLIGTTTRPEGKAEMDVDLVLLLKRGLESQVACTSLLEGAHASLATYAQQHGLKAKRKCRCVQLQYSGQMHADVTPVVRSPRADLLHGTYHGLVPDRELREYQGTNPEGYGHWFGEAASKVPSFQLRSELEVLAKAEVTPLPSVAIFDRLLSRIVQLFKIHRNVMFQNEPEFAPTSTFITTIAAQAYLHALGEQHVSPLDFIFRVWSDMLRFIHIRYDAVKGAVEWVVLNPTADTDNLAGRMNTPERQQAFHAWHTRFGQDLLSMAQFYVGHGQGMDVVTKSVTSSFGERSGRAVSGSLRGATERQRASNMVVVPVTGAAAVLNSSPHRFHGDE